MCKIDLQGVSEQLRNEVLKMLSGHQLIFCLSLRLSSRIEDDLLGKTIQYQFQLKILDLDFKQNKDLKNSLL